MDEGGHDLGSAKRSLAKERTTAEGVHEKREFDKFTKRLRITHTLPDGRWRSDVATNLFPPSSLRTHTVVEQVNSDLDRIIQVTDHKLIKKEIDEVTKTELTHEERDNNLKIEYVSSKDAAKKHLPTTTAEYTDRGELHHYMFYYPFTDTTGARVIFFPGNISTMLRYQRETEFGVLLDDGEIQYGEEVEFEDYIKFTPIRNNDGNISVIVDNEGDENPGKLAVTIPDGVNPKVFSVITNPQPSGWEAAFSQIPSSYSFEPILYDEE